MSWINLIYQYVHWRNFELLYKCVLFCCNVNFKSTLRLINQRDNNFCGFLGGYFVIIHISNKRKLTNRNNQMLIHCLSWMSFSLFVLYRWRSFHQMGTSPLPRQRFRRTLFRFVKYWNTCNISPANIYNTVPDNYFSAVVAFLHPLKMQIRKNPYVPNYRSLPREFETTFVFNVFHMTGEIFTF